jgi:hypothetical protein
VVRDQMDTGRGLEWARLGANQIDLVSPAPEHAVGVGEHLARPGHVEQLGLGESEDKDSPGRGRLPRNGGRLPHLSSP